MATASDAEISRALAAIEDPNSPEYHHYLTPEEYAQRFGPSAAALATVERSLSDAGFRVTLPRLAARSWRAGDGGAGGEVL